MRKPRTIFFLPSFKSFHFLAGEIVKLGEKKIKTFFIPAFVQCDRSPTHANARGAESETAKLSFISVVTFEAIARTFDIVKNILVKRLLRRQNFGEDGAGISFGEIQT